jgi:radical SAM superfamily enzyme YgiQ (UPF0313 family)
MRTVLGTVSPYGVTGMAPYYLKSYYVGKVDPAASRDIVVLGYDVVQDDLLVARDICGQAPDVVGFSCYIWNIEKVLRLCQIIRAWMPRTHIVLGGPEVAPRAIELVQGDPALDVIAVGEGEVTFAQLLQHLERGEPEIHTITGIVYREDKHVRATSVRQPLASLNEIPSPFLAGIVEFDKMKGYLYGYETFRGCPFSCSFCYWGRMFDVRYFPMERVKAELAVVLHAGLERIWLADAVANLHKQRFKEFLRAVIDNDSSTIIDFEMIAELLDDETIDLLGLLRDGYVAFGLQSINYRALANINRKWDRDKFEVNVKRLRQRTDKIRIYIDLIYGLPGDDLRGYEASIRYAMSLLPHKIQPHPLLVLPGSPFFANPAAYGLVYDTRAPHVVRKSNTFSEADVEAAAGWTKNLFFYFNPAVNTTLIMLSQILREEPLDLFERIYRFVASRLDPVLVFTDIGVDKKSALSLNLLLEEFVRSVLPTESAYLAALIDVAAFAGYRTMYYFPRAVRDGTARAAGLNGSACLQLSRHVVLKRFSHDMGALSGGNLLRLPEELLRLKPRAYDVVFNLRTHSAYHVSPHLSELLAGCSGNRRLEQLVDALAAAHNLGVSEDTYATVRATFEELARHEVIAPAGYP